MVQFNTLALLKANIKHYVLHSNGVLDFAIDEYALDLG